MASDSSPVDLRGSFPTTRERRPFLKLAPLVIPPAIPDEIRPGLAELEARVGDDVQIVVRSLVGFTVSKQIAEQRRVGRPVGVPHGVLNRRRRAARAWIVALLGGRIDGETLQMLTRSWIPQLTGTGPEVGAAIPAGVQLIEFLRGAITALVMDRLAENLVPHARALQALETVLSIHLRALREAGKPAGAPE